jgi:apolipoprotein N-acyltransferase
VRYEKQILLPMVEYLPFEWCRKWSAEYGIMEFFEKGKTIKVMDGKVPFAITICYEESFGEMVRKGRKMGAKLLVNVSNNVWFPSSRLPDQFLNLASLRAVENGIPVIRACNTGVTSIIDRFGNTLHRFGNESKDFEFLSGVLTADLPIITISTLYSFWGDLFMIFLGILGIYVLFHYYYLP